MDGWELWTALESKTDFSNWIKRRFDECDAKENQDYSLLAINGGAENKAFNRIDYIVKLSIAKEMAMLERNGKV